MKISIILKKRIIQNLLFVSIIFCFVSNSYSQNTWELLNPKPSSNTGIDIQFVSSNVGYIINYNEILETLDAGISWQKKQNITSGNDLNFYKTTGYIVGNDGYVLKSNDNGASWTQVVTGFIGDFNTVNVISQTDIIISSKYAIIKSSDGGSTWTSKTIPNVNVNKTFFVTALIGHAACNSGTMLKTIDGGENWYVTQSSNVTPSNLFTVYFINQNIGFYTKEHSDMYKTIDGGETWTKVLNINDALYTFSFLNENIGYAAGDHGVIFKTTDGGSTWAWAGFQKGRIYSTSIYGIHFLDNNIGYATGSRGRIIKTIDGGNTWVENSPTYNDISQLQFIDKNIGYAQVGNNFFKTSDSGNNWLNVGSLNLGQSVSASKFTFLNDNLGYATTGGPYGGHVFKTINGGITWASLNNGYEIIDEGITSISFINENIGFISGGYNQPLTFKTINGGASWQQIGIFRFGQIQFLNEKVGYARNTGSSIHRIYKTVDGGNTWAITFENEQDINSFDFIDENNGYFVGDNGLMYKTKNGGVSWEKLTIPYEYYKFVKFYSNNVGYIFDEDGKLYKTINGGISWEYLTMISSAFNSNSISIIEKNIYVAGTNGKILKSNIEFAPVAIHINPVQNPSNKSATLTGNVTSNGGLIENIRFEYSLYYTFENIINITPNTVMPNSSLDLSTSLLNLNPNSTYYVRLKAIYNNTEYTSEILNFTTLPDYVLTMNPVYSYSSNTAEVTGNITSNQNDILNIEFQYGIKEDFSDFSIMPSSTLVTANTTENIINNLSNLKPETTYYIRIKALHNGIEIYSEVQSFTTRSEYSIYLYNPSINGNNVTLSAYISTYSKDITNIVFEYGTINYENNVITSVNQIPINTSNYVNATLSNLDPNLAYYYRLKALNGTDLIYSKEGVFNTSGTIILVPGTINSKTSSINLVGLVKTYGDYLTNIQFEYGLTENYGSTIEGLPNYAYGYSTNTITATLDNLLPNQTYYYRLKATNNSTLIYSNQFQFKTSTLNIDDPNANNTKILLYPNPTNNETNITINDFKHAVSIMLIDVSGKILMSQDNSNLKKDFKFNLSDKSKGIYFIRILFDDNTFINKKLILK